MYVCLGYHIDSSANQWNFTVGDNHPVNILISGDFDESITDQRTNGETRILIERFSEKFPRQWSRRRRAKAAKEWALTSEKGDGCWQAEASDEYHCWRWTQNAVAAVGEAVVVVVVVAAVSAVGEGPAVWRWEAEKCLRSNRKLRSWGYLTVSMMALRGGKERRGLEIT